MAGIEDRDYRAEKIGFWDDVYGFTYNSVKKWALVEPLVENCPSERLMTGIYELLNFDLNRVTVEMLNIDCNFTLIPTKDDTLDALAVWFDVTFDGPQRRVVLSTSPFSPGTRWYHTIFYLETPIPIVMGTEFHGNFHMDLNIENPKEQDWVITYEVDGQPYSQRYRMR
jgi:protein arginine N-methyltransferase 1